MTNNLDLSNRINQNYSLLSKKEKQVAAFILEHKKDIESWNIKDLSRLTETSNATISRFCAKLSYRNFNEFKTLNFFSSGKFKNVCFAIIYLLCFNYI